MKKQIIYTISIFLLVINFGCKNQNIQKIDIESFIKDTLMSLNEVKNISDMIETSSNHQKIIDFQITKPIKPSKEYTIIVGNKQDDKFDFYYNFTYNSETKQINRIDFLTGNQISLEDFYNNFSDEYYLNVGFDLLNYEKFDKLKLQMPISELITFLGEPDQKEEATLWGADGYYHQEWIYTTQGISLNIAWENPSEKTLNRIELTTPCEFKSSKNIGIGSTRYDVFVKYYKEIDLLFSDLNNFVIGSVYGGIIIQFENNVVTNIFFGAAAE
jgi:hypothetical protein